jgi:hypothetical protein
MSINSIRKRGKPFFTLSRTADTFVIGLTLLVGGFMFNPIASISDTSAQEENNDTTESATLSNTTTSAATSSSSLGMELSQDLVYQEDEKLVSQSPINQTHAELIVSANGILTLPNTTETIRTTATKTGIVSMMDGTFAGKEILTTEDGRENATATIYEIVRFNMESGNGTGIAMALFHTNSTELLAPLGGMILTGHGELHTDGTGVYSLWKWKIGIPR